MKSPWSIRRLPPILVVALLVVVVGTLTVDSVLAVRAQALATTEERLQRLAAQVSASINLSAARTRLDALDAAARSDAVVGFLSGVAPEAEARARLAAIDPGALGDTTSVSLWDAAGVLRLEARAGSVAELSAVAPVTVDTPAVGPLQAATDSVVTYDLIAPVRSAGRVIGAVVDRRRLGAGNAAGMRAIMGPGGAVLLGNRDGSLWTQGSVVVEGPAASDLAETPGETSEYSRAGQDYIGALTAFGETPWVGLLEVRSAEALAPARRFLARMLVIAAVLVALGALASWALGHRLTAPLEQLREAVARISAGDYSTRAVVTAPAEVAHLAAGFNSMVEQVEDRRKALAASESRFRSLVNATTQIVWYAGPDGRVDHPLPAWQGYTGQSEHEIGGDGWLDAVHPDDRNRFADAWSKASKANGPFGFECRIRSADGGVRLFDVRGVPVRAEDGAIHEWVGTCTDVEQQRAAERELRRAEEELRQSKKMEAIGRLAGGVAHDFNNLLTGILAPATFARQQLGDDHPVTPDLDDIRAAALRAAELTKQLLTFSRARSLRLSVLDLNEVVGDSAKLLRRVIGERIELTLVLDAELSRVRADRGQLDQVILNLAVNAQQAMPTGGRMTIETRDVELGDDYVRRHPSVRPGPYVLLAVSDTGVGMSESTMERIFEPFFTTKAEDQGTGLGLATVHGIVQQSGGHVWAYSEPGQGSTFKVYLPMVEDAAQEAGGERPKSRSVVGGAETIVLVEDDDRVRRVTERTLRGFGYLVSSATNGAEALELLREQPDVSLVITDMVMPRMSGAELAVALRDTVPDVPVLFLSGYAQAAAAGQDLLHGDEPFLHKPFTPEELAAVVRELLDGGSG